MTALVLLSMTGCFAHRPGISRDVKEPAPSNLPGSPVSPVTPSQQGVRAEQGPRLQALARSVQRDPHDAKAQARYGSALVEAGEGQAGIGHLRRSVLLNPRLTAAWHNLGLAAERQGWLDVAVDAYAHVVAAEPAHVGEWVKFGYLDMRLGRYREAEQAFQRASALAPNSSEPLVATASLHAADFRYNDAITTLRRAIALNPRSTAAMADMAAVQLEAGNRSEAEQAIRAALLAAPQTARYRVMLGRILADSPDRAKRDEAKRSLEQALSMTQQPDVALITSDAAGANQLLGGLALREGKHEEALTWWRRALDLDPTRPDTLLALSHALIRRGGTDEAMGRRLLQEYRRVQAQRDRERELRQRVEEHPGDGVLRYRYASLLLDQGNVARAVWELEQAVRLRPTLAEARRALAAALRRQGRDDEATAAVK